METEVHKGEDGSMYIPLPFEAREAITLELLIEDYKTLMDSHMETTKKLHQNPQLNVAKQDYQDEHKFKQAFETLIKYYGG